jgi:hypothetical protein
MSRSRKMKRRERKRRRRTMGRDCGCAISGRGCHGCVPVEACGELTGVISCVFEFGTAPNCRREQA